MNAPLRELLGLPEIKRSEVEKQNQDFSKAFRASMERLNTDLQLMSVQGDAAVHQKFDAQRQDLYAAYQNASALGDPAANGRVVAAAANLSDKVSAHAASTQAAKEEWIARQADFDEALAKIADLHDAGHPKAESFRMLGDAIQGRLNSRDFSQAIAALDQLQPKLGQIPPDLQFGSNGNVPGNGGVSVAPSLVKIDVTPATATLYGGKSVQFTATGEYSDGSSQDLTYYVDWSPSDNAISIDGSGFATASYVSVPPIQITALDRNTGVSGHATITLALPPLKSITIKQGDFSLREDGERQLTADGLYADGTTADVTRSVDWTSSAPQILSIGKNTGLAKAHKVKPPLANTATVTAKANNTSASITVTVVEPILQFITVSEADSNGSRGASTSSPIFQGTKRQFKATGIFDGFTKDITHEVDWASSPPGIVSIDDKGQATAENLGPATIHATDKSNNQVAGKLDVTVEVNTNPPAAPHAALMRIDISPAKSFDANPDQVLKFRASAVYANGETRDWTTAVEWSSSTPDHVNIDNKTGVAQAKNFGPATISARVRQPVKAMHARGGVYQGGIDSVTVTVMGAAPKTPVQVPKGGRLTKKVATTLIKNLVHLANPKFMQRPAASPGKLPATGDPAVDKLVEMTAKVVKLWHDYKTLAEARQIWQQVQPRFSQLLKEAESPAVGVKREDINPALDAVGNISTRVMASPGSVANSQPNSHPNTSDFPDIVRDRAVYVKTPYGELFYLTEHKQDIERLITPILTGIPQARQALTTIDKRLKEQQAVLKPLAGFLKSPEATKKEVHRTATDKSITKAGIAEVGKNAVGLAKNQLNTLNNLLSQAKSEYQRALSTKEILDKEEKARQLREKAQRQDEILNTCLGILGNAIDKITTGATSTFKLAFDAVTALERLLNENNTLTRAKELEEEARKAKFENAANHIASAIENLSKLASAILTANETLNENQQDYAVLRDRAEYEYDLSSTGSKFKFRDLAAASKAVGITRDAATFGWRAWEGLVVLVGMLVEQYTKAGRLQIGAGYDENNRPTRHYVDFLQRNKPVTDAILRDAKKYSAETRQKENDADAQLDKLNDLRDQANEALFTAPEPKAGRR